MNDNHLSEVRYADLPIDPSILQSLNEIGFEFCTPVQAETLKFSLNDKDVTGQAQTGTGKTAAFLVAVMQRLLSTKAEGGTKPGNIGCLILAPTRELAIQIADDATKLAKHTGLKTALVYGGTAYEKQKRQFEQPVDILVGTPGRIIDYFKQKCFTLRNAQSLVLDEADRMFDLGFINDIRFLLRRLPAPSKRLNMLFSATLSQRVLELAYEHMDNPEKVEIKSESVSAKNVSQKVYYPANSEKIPLLIGILQKEQPFRSIVFVNTKRNAEKIDDFLRGNKISAAMISGDVKQNKRQRLLEEFEKGKHSVLIATDVAARGLHIPDVSHVINFDLPQHQEDYVHRIGRTARAGASGDSISFACEDTAFYLPEIEEYIGMSIPVESISSELLPDIKRPVRVQRDRVGGHHKNDKRTSGNRSGTAKGNRNKNTDRNKTSNQNTNASNQRRRAPRPKKPNTPDNTE